jgi:uncharacterized OB-fold protein
MSAARLTRNPLRVWRCDGCGEVRFPRPALCGRCGSRAFTAQEARDGVLEQATEQRGPDGASLRLGTVRTDAGPVVIARLLGGEPGDAVRVRVRRGAIEAAP